jgi:hypothetical protein
LKRISSAFRLTAVVALLAAGCGGGEPQNNVTGSTPAPAQPPAVAPATGSVDVTLTTQPDPPRRGEAIFEATVMQGGQAVTDADVSVDLFMAAMPSMNMPDMKNSVALKHEGSGRYRGAGNVMMAGSWDATVSVKRGGQEIGNRKVSIVAK